MKLKKGAKKCRLKINKVENKKKVEETKHNN